MLDVDDVLTMPKSIAVFVLRALWWLGWEFLFQGIGWSIGWCFYRLVTFGYFPKEGLRDMDEASWPRLLFVDLSGLAILAAAIWFLSGRLP